MNDRNHGPAGHRKAVFRRQCALVMAAMFAAVAPSTAQEAYPSKPVTLVNPNAPGGIVDIAGRALANALQKPLKQTVLVVNRPGANGAVGTQAVLAAPADGYTLLFSSPSFLSVPAIDRLFERPASYAVDQFVPIAQITSDPTVLVAHPSIGVTTVAELAALTKSKPFGVVMTSSGTHGATHLPLAMFEMATGGRMRHVAANGGGPAFALTLGGHAQLVASAPGVAFPQVAAGKLRAIAQTGARRYAPFTDTPTLKESGIDVEYHIWTALFAPAKLPAAVLKTIAEATRAASEDESMRAALAKANANMAYVDGDAFRALVAREAAAITAAVNYIGKVEDDKPK